jgi:hypothetical protein
MRIESQEAGRVGGFFKDAILPALKVDWIEN